MLLAAPRTEPLQQYLRTLWRLAPVIAFDAPSPALAAGTIRLPPRAPAGVGDAWRWHCAAAAHVGAHLVFSPRAFDGRGLRPIVRALLGVLEDARVEALAGRELPGLQRLWAGLHTATPADGDDAATLLLRLARVLADRRYDDPHAWVRKGRALFYGDAAGEVLALPHPRMLVEVASRLGNDIGQMRLQFNARGWLPGPSYRDDNHWMWPPPEAGDDEAAGAHVNDDGPAAAQPPADGAPGHRVPEWDRLIGRLRQDWCQVHEHEAPAGADPGEPPDASMQRATREALARIAPVQARRRLDEVGERFDPDALVRARLGQRLRHAIDPRLFRSTQRLPVRGRAVVLVDQSASSGDRFGDSGATVLDASREAALLVADAFEARGMATMLWGFSSAGREAVHIACAKRGGERIGDAVRARLQALRPGGSTRLGAALRHAARSLAGGAGPRVVVVIGDGRPHDIDVHDPRYLVADARHAIASAARRGVRTVALVLDPAAAADARRMFGARHAGVLTGSGRLPGVLRRLSL